MERLDQTNTIWHLAKKQRSFILSREQIGISGEEPTCQCRRCKRCRFNPWVQKMLWRRAWQATPVFSPGKSHGQRSLVGYSPLGCKESDMTEVT